MRIAILGGSFDPVHKGHLQIAKTALKKLKIDEVWFMPTLCSPLKQGQTASYSDRCAMVQRAIRPYRKLKLSRLEGEWKDQSYTIRTVKQLKKRYPNDTFCWLIGDDQAQHFDQWKDSEALKRFIDFYVFTREQQLIELPEGLQRVEMDLMPISSSNIRMGQSLSMVPKAVMDYIGKEGLYLASMVQSHMSEKRFLHSVSVAKLCVALAHAHGLDEDVAYRMGLVHDICKEMPKKQAQIWIQHHMPEALLTPPAIWHGYYGAAYMKQVFHIYDKRIFEAVFHHVIGRNKTAYDRILFIADKLDPTRGYDVSKEIELSKQNLKKGFAIVKQQQSAYLKKEGTL